MSVWMVLAVYPLYIIVLWALLDHGGLSTMISGIDYVPIPDEFQLLIIGVIAIVAILGAYVAYLVRYNDFVGKCEEIRMRAAEEKRELTAEEKVKIEGYEKVDRVYYAAMVVLIGITMGLTYLTLVMGADLFGLVGFGDYFLVSVAAGTVICIAADKLVIHPIADRTFDKKIREPLITSLTTAFQTADKKDSGVSADMLAQLKDIFSKL